MTELALTNNLNNNVSLEKKQNNFLQTNIGKIINTGLDIGLRYLLPDFIEDQIINIKDSMLENGFKEGVKEVVNSTIELGKSVKGIFTGEFESVSQVQAVIKNGGLLDNVSDLINTVVNKVVDTGKISYNVGNVIKKGKNVILDNISSKLENEFESQLDSIEKINKYSNNWKEYYNNKDFEGMEREYKKIKEKMKDVIPLETTIKEARTIENLHSLIKNNDQKFNLTEEQKELVKIL